MKTCRRENLSFKGIPAYIIKLTFDMLLSMKKYEEMYYTLGCKNVPNKSS